MAEANTPCQMKSIGHFIYVRVITLYFLNKSFLRVSILLIILDNFENAKTFKGGKKSSISLLPKATTIPTWLAFFLLIFFSLYTFKKQCQIVRLVLHSTFLSDHYIVSSSPFTVL